MPQEVKIFNGASLNSNDAIEYTAPTDILDGYNVRIQTQENNQQGLVVTIEGNRVISRSLPTGTNTCIRTEYFPHIGKAFLFIKNSNNRNRIEEFDPKTETFTTLVENITNTGGANVLNWSSVVYIKDVAIVQKRLLYWTEFPTDKVRRIDVEKAKSSGYGTIAANDLELIVVPPIISPVAEYSRDGGYNYNNLTQRLFQFRYAYKYDNGEQSTYSPMSNRAIPIGEPNVSVSSDLKNNNVLVVSVNAGNSRVNALTLSFRVGEGDWYFLKSVDRSYILSLPDDDIDFFAGRKEVYNVATNTYTFAFYNDALYTIEDQLAHQQLADYAPLKSRAMEVVNDNTVLLANNEYGYDKPSLTPSNTYAQVGYTSSGGTAGGFRVVSFTNLGGNNFQVIFAGTPVEDDMIRSVWYVSTSPPIPDYHNYYVPSADEGSLIDAVEGYSDSLVSAYGITSVVVSTIGSEVRLGFSRNINEPVPSSFSIDNAIPINNSVPTLKLQSSYQLAIAYYDRFERPFPLYTNDNLIVKTDAFASTEGLIPYITWNLPASAPAGATHYRICATKNRTHAATWYTVSNRVGKSTSPGGDATYSMNITPLFTLNSQSQDGTLGYDFVDGDRVNIIGEVDSTGAISNWRNSPIYNFRIKGLFVNASGGGGTTYEITFDVVDASVLISENIDYLIEIYRPKVSTPQDVEVYYELPETYTISNGQHSVTSGEIHAIDSFVRSRQMIFPEAGGAGIIPAESLHFSDFYTSNFPQLGRPRSLTDTPSSFRYVAEIRYSREWISGSSVNWINRFYPEDVYDSREPMYGASENYGGIQYITNRENRLICLQEVKIGYIPVNRSIIEDTVEQQQVAISSKLLNPIQYYAGQNIGIGNDHAITSYKFANGSAYFIDPHEMLPVRAGTDGSRYIDGKYTGKLKQEIRDHLASGLYLYSAWDDRMNEWLLITLTGCQVFDEKIDGWVPRRTYYPEQGFTANDRLYTLKNGALYIHDQELTRNRFYGVDYDAEILIPLTSPGVKTYQSLAIHSTANIVTSIAGIETEQGQESGLELPEDYVMREGIRYANFYRDSSSPGGLINGDRLKGRWIKLRLREDAPVSEWNLLKVVVNSSYSTPNE